MNGTSSREAVLPDGCSLKNCAYHSFTLAQPSDLLKRKGNTYQNSLLPFQWGQAEESLHSLSNYECTLPSTWRTSCAGHSGGGKRPAILTTHFCELIHSKQKYKHHFHFLCCHLTPF